MFGDSFYSFGYESIEDNVLKSKDALGEMKDQLFYIFYVVLILDRVRENSHDKFDPMLDEFSLFDNMKHDSHDCEKK